MSLVAESDEPRATLPTVTCQHWVVPRFHDQRDMFARIRAEEHQIAGFRFRKRDLDAICTNGPCVSDAVVVPAVWIGRLGFVSPAIAQGHKAGAIHRERQSAWLIHPVDRPLLVVLDRRVHRNAPQSVRDDLQAKDHRDTILERFDGLHSGEVEGEYQGGGGDGDRRGQTPIQVEHLARPYVGHH